MRLTTDSRIVEEVLSGNKEAYAEVVVRYKGPIYNLAFRMTASVEDARDLSQETFVRAFAGLHRYRPDKNFFTWLYTICLNLTRNHLAKRREVLTSDGDLPPSRGDGPSPERLVSEREEIAWLEKALGSLSVDLREAVVLRYMQGLSFEETAEVLGASVSAAKMRVYRGLEKLRELKESEDVESGRPVARRSDGCR